MARSIELGAGLAAAVLTVITLAVLLAAPIVAICPGHVTTDGRCSTALHFITLVAAGKQVNASTWIFIIVMALVMLAGGIGAALDGVLGQRLGALLLWPAAVIAFGGCALTALAGGALSLFFLPPVLAICIAAYAALALRGRGVRRPRGGTDERSGRAGRGELS
jgi:hypothetical protein